MEIFSYVVARDFGFAPNPFHGYCTLSSCKPLVRAKAKIGDFIVGTRAAPNSDEIIYFMRVTEMLTFQQYWDDPRFEQKRPFFFGNLADAFGDNIYHKDIHGNWIQEDSHHAYEDGTPCEGNIRKDTKSDCVLISNDFTYWGRASVTVPFDLKLLVKAGPGHKSPIFDEGFKSKFLLWVNQQQSGILGLPLDWRG